MRTRIARLFGGGVRSLIEAIRAGDETRCRKLLDDGVSARVRGLGFLFVSESPLCAAVSADRESIARLLIERGAGLGWGPNDVDALRTAIALGRQWAVALILDFACADGISSNERLWFNARMADAAVGDQLETVSCFLEHGFDVKNWGDERFLSHMSPRMLRLIHAHGAQLPPWLAAEIAITDPSQDGRS